MLPNQLDKNLRDSRKGERRYVHHVYDQQRLGDFSGRCQGADGLHDVSGLADALLGIVSRRLCINQPVSVDATIQHERAVKF